MPHTVPQGKVNILLVEDNEGYALLLQASLAEAGIGEFEIVHVDRVEKAVEKLRAESFDLVLLDLYLPDSQGLETVTTVLKDKGNSAIVVLSGVDDEETAIEAIRKGAQDYLVKGQTDIRLIIRALRYALERRHYRKELEALNRELQNSLETVKKLEGLLPICASCKKIRNDKGYWDELENYFQNHSEVVFTHGLCPECAKTLYDDTDKNSSHQ